MTAIHASRDRVLLEQSAEQDLRTLDVPRDAALSLHTAAGEPLPLPASTSETLLEVLRTLVEHGSVSVRPIPEQLTSTAAADLLGVSRPTVMTWAREGRLASFRVGTHRRFPREDVLRLRDDRRQELREATAALRDFDAEHADVLED